VYSRRKSASRCQGSGQEGPQSESDARELEKVVTSVAWVKTLFQLYRPATMLWPSLKRDENSIGIAGDAGTVFAPARTLYPLTEHVVTTVTEQI